MTFDAEEGARSNNHLHTFSPGMWDQFSSISNSFGFLLAYIYEPHSNSTLDPWAPWNNFADVIGDLDGLKRLERRIDNKASDHGKLKLVALPLLFRKDCSNKKITQV